MDSITHLALGACMGEIFAEKKLGKKAMLWGALAQSVPDIDFLASFWMDTPSNLLAHRGFTHSFLFLLMIFPLMAFLAEKLHRPHNIKLKKWMFFFFTAIFIHIFLDAFNNYGVGWFEPFSHHRVSFNAIYVADPFFTIGPLLAVCALIYLKRKNPQRKKWLKIGLGWSSIYLLVCIINKIVIDGETRQILKKQQIEYSNYFTTPAPLQNWLWYIVAKNDSGYHVGFRSLFDDKKEIDFQFFPHNTAWLNTIDDHVEIQKLIRFSKGFYTVEKWTDTLVFNDLRFGQIIGWQEPRARFVFHYYLQHPKENTLVVQRGRFQGWTWKVFQALLRRIYGN